MTRARAVLDLATKSLTITGQQGGIWSGVSTRSADQVAARAGWVPAPGTPTAVPARALSSPPDGFTWEVIAS